MFLQEAGKQLCHATWRNANFGSHPTVLVALLIIHHVQPSAGLPSPSSEIASMIAALSKRSGTIATILLDTSSGSLIYATGHLPSSAPKTAPFNNTPSATGPDQVKGPSEEELQTLGAMAVNLVKGAGALVESLDPEDQTKLLRLRTKK